MSESTCGTCKHWHKQPANPLNLAAPAQGACQESPPAVMLVQMNNGQAQQISTYPLLPATFAACSRHAVQVLANGVTHALAR